MIFDDQAILGMVRQAANMSGKAQDLYQRHSGEYIYCAEGMLPMLKQVLKENEQLTYIRKVYPDGREPTV